MLCPSVHGGQEGERERERQREKREREKKRAQIVHDLYNILISFWPFISFNSFLYLDDNCNRHIDICFN